MKKNLLLLVSIVTLVFSCSKDETDTPETPVVVNKPVVTTTTPVTPITPIVIETPTTTPVIVEPTNITWKNWYLSVPINNGEGKASSIYYEDILSNNLTEEESEYFFRNEDGSYSLFTKFTGYTTSTGSPFGLNEGKYCRTELREYWQGIQDTDENWLMSDGTHILESTLQIESCADDEDYCQTIVAQIHGKESPGIEGNPATVIVQWRNGELGLDYYQKPSDGNEWGKDNKKFATYAVDVDREKFTVRLKVEGGKLYYSVTCEAKNIDYPYNEVYDYVGNGYIHENYFKTGNYFTQDDNYTRTSQVKLYEVKTEHY